MKAIVQNDYGSPEVLKIKEIGKPVIKDNEVLIEVHAAALNAGDYFALAGNPYLVRFTAGWPKPKDYIPGYDVAGIIAAVGNKVKGFKEGDAVFGACNRACAEYTHGAEKNFIMKPANISFEQAAAIPTAGVTALIGLRDAGKLRKDQQVLINGASGGVGTFAVQIAKAFGAEVTGVCSSRNADLVRSIGADHVIDYTGEDFTLGERTYDLILDNVGNHTLSEYKRVLAKHGKVIPNSGHAGLGYVLKAFLMSTFVPQQGKPYMVIPGNQDLADIKKLVESGDVLPVIDKTYPLDDTAEAFRYMTGEHARGKVVITI